MDRRSFVSLALGTLLAVGAAGCAVGEAHVTHWAHPDATNFESCPAKELDAADVKSEPTSAGVVSVPNTTGDIWTKNPGSSARGNTEPFGVEPWFGPGFHWVFVSTKAGIAVLDYQRGTPASGGTIEREGAFRGMTVVETGRGQARLYAVRNDSRVLVFDIDSDAPWIPASTQTLDVDVTVSGLEPCSEAGADPSSTMVKATKDLPGLVFLSNECGGSGAGSVDVIDTTGKLSVMRQRVRVDTNPVGLAFGSLGELLFVTNEGATSASTQRSVGEGVGSLMVFKVAREPADDRVLELVSAVNAGCTPTRVAAGQDRVWVSARGSNDVQVFDANRLRDGAEGARMGVFGVGPQPVGLELFDGGDKLVVANSYRSDRDNRTAGDLGEATPSTMVFKVDDVLASFDGDAGAVRKLPPHCHVRGTPNGYGDFPRNVAADDQRIYTTLSGAASLQATWRTEFEVEGGCL